MSEYRERITGYTFLTGKCTVCQSTEVVIRVESKRKYNNPSIISGNFSNDYCKDHSPIDIKKEREYWQEVLMTPPGL